MSKKHTPGDWFCEPDCEGGWLVHTEHAIDHPDAFRDPVGAYCSPPIAWVARREDAELIARLPGLLQYARQLEGGQG